MTGWLRRHRSILVIVLGTLVALAVAVALGAPPTNSAAHDPQNPGATGAQALARVLADEGIEVDIVRSADALETRTLDRATTVLVTSPDNLGRSTASRLLTAAGESTVIVAGPGPGATEALGIDAAPLGDPVSEPRPARCTDTGHGDLSGLAIQVDRADAFATTAGCFPAPSGWLLASASDRLVLLGAPGVLENDQILRADNAAVALRLLGQQPRVVWYVPSLADLVGNDGVSLRSLLPSWLVPSIWLLGLVMAAVIWWRGSRLGALAVEPLPVSVRSLETTQARGRLYRAASERAHAALMLRRATRRSLAQHLRHPSTATDVLIRDVATRLGRPASDIDQLIGDAASAPGSDDELIRLANQLAELDREVRRT